MTSIILIASVCKYNNKLGIGYKKQIPWYEPEDLKFFKNETINNVVVMGRNTFESIGKPLKNRINIVLSSKLSHQDGIIIARTFQEIETIINSFKNKKIYIIGGEDIYTYFINKCNSIIITEIYGNYICDTFFPEIDNTFKLVNYSFQKISASNNKYRHLHYNSSIPSKIDIEYIKLMNKIINNGNKRIDRTNIGTISSFGETMKFDISNYACLLTTKKVAWKSCIKELLWFLRGETNSNILRKQNVNIWNGNSTREFLDNRGLSHYPEGELGKIYGWQIRHSGGDFKNKTGGIDQLAYIEDLLENDPFSRRILWNLWIPSDLNDMALTCCHYSFQLYVEKDFKTNDMMLSGLVNIRSNDLFLGNPFNIFSYSVLIKMLALRHNMKPKELIINIGDAHIYLNHLEQVKTQLSRTSRSQPIIDLDKSIKDKKWEDITIDDFDLVGYFPHPSIKADMAI